MAEASREKTNGIEGMGREISKSISPKKGGHKAPANKVVKNKKVGKGKIPESKEEDLFETEEEFDCENDAEDMEA